MPLVQENKITGTPADGLVDQAAERLSEFSKTALLVYGNLINYQHNNSIGVTSEQYIKAWGKLGKDYVSAVGALKRLLRKLNPSLKEQLDSMVPKKSKKPRA